MFPSTQHASPATPRPPKPRRRLSVVVAGAVFASILVAGPAPTPAVAAAAASPAPLVGLSH